jgi:hypothetical protein
MSRIVILLRVIMRARPALLASVAACQAETVVPPEQVVEQIAESPDGAADELRANGQETGAFLRQTTPSGYTCILTNVRAPAYGDKAIQPWVYFGFGNERGVDVELGLAYQAGDGSAPKPARYLPYARIGRVLWYAAEVDRVLPGELVALRARVVGEKAYLNKNGMTVRFTRVVDAGVAAEIDPADFVRVTGLVPGETHVRRVVGLALDKYDGKPLLPFGPVEFISMRVCDSAGGEVPFRGSVASWSERRGPTLFGTAATPKGAVRVQTIGDTERIRLF